VRDYAAAIVAVVAALLLRHWLDEPLDDTVPYSTFYVAIVFAVYVGGVGPAILATALSYMAGTYLFLAPRFTFGLDQRTAFASIIFLVSAASIVAIGAAMNRARRRAEASAAEARLRGEQAAREAAERQQAMDALRATEARLSRVLQSDIAGIAFWRTDGTLREANDAFLRFLGYDRDDLPTLNWRALTPPDWSAVDDRAIREMKARGFCTPFEKEFLRKDGTRVPVLIGAAVFEDRDEGVAIVIDMTDRKRLAAQLEEQVDKLTESDRRKDEFLATLAHELRNPLAPIRTALQLLARPGQPPEAIERYRRMMERQVKHMIRLVDDLLDVSRITRGKVELRRERLALAAVVDSAVEASRPNIEAAGHRLDVTLPPGQVTLEADGTRLAQVLSNLLNNAAHFTPRGGHIQLSAALTGAAPHRQLVLTVKDNGRGIASDQLARVFELFTQIDGAPGAGGLGIGLSLVKGLVELHGGSVEARSPGRGLGSEFIVRLPGVVEERAPDADGNGHAGAPRGTPRRILIVDDNRDAAESLADLLAFLGHETRTAHDGQSGLEAATAFRPEIVLLDLGMPGMSGFDVARALRADPALRELTIVALTGWGQDEDRRRTREAGFDHHLVKPPDPDALERLLAAPESTVS
jgi:PAS domain S-box-containing protein